MRGQTRRSELAFLVAMIITVSVLAGFTGDFNISNSPPTVTISDTIGKTWTVTNLTTIAIDNNILRFEWNFGDGIYENVSWWEKDKIKFSEENVSCTVSHEYEKGGVSHVRVKVVDREGLSSTAECNVTIYPLADAGEDQIVYAGETVWLNGTVYVLDGYVGEFIWDCDGDKGIDHCNNAGPWNCKREYISDEHFIVTGWFNITSIYDNSGVIEAVFVGWTTIGDDYDTCTITVLSKKNNTIFGDMK